MGKIDPETENYGATQNASEKEASPKIEDVVKQKINN